jgi:hypothetical protein
MTFDSIKSYSYTSVSDAIIASIMVNPKPGTPTIHHIPFIFFDNSYSGNQIPSLNNDEELTLISMLVSEKSLAKDWDNEDDDRWHKFLINE